MRLASFFVLLCFLLLRGGDHAHAGLPKQGFRYSQANQVKSPIQDFTLSVGLEPDQEYLDADNVEDEDANNFFAKKFRLTDVCLSITFYQLFPGYLFSPFCESAHITGQISDRYILHRTLRI